MRDTPSAEEGGREEERTRTYMMKATISPHQWHNLTYSERKSVREDIERVKRERNSDPRIIGICTPQEIGSHSEAELIEHCSS